ncbi:hypothetical protein GGR56DRAFT_638350 [Xylariaceae sp. FL0804]|nr:hypothetical protein GGR56DRAFT_638350 [Xylariaceae sp. FL0804]
MSVAFIPHGPPPSPVSRTGERHAAPPQLRYFAPPRSPITHRRPKPPSKPTFSRCCWTACRAYQNKARWQIATEHVNSLSTLAVVLPLRFPASSSPSSSPWPCTAPLTPTSGAIIRCHVRAYIISRMPLKLFPTQHARRRGSTVSGSHPAPIPRQPGPAVGPAQSPSARDFVEGHEPSIHHSTLRRAQPSPEALLRSGILRVSSFKSCLRAPLSSVLPATSL